MCGLKVLFTVAMSLTHTQTAQALRSQIHTLKMWMCACVTVFLVGGGMTPHVQCYNNYLQKSKTCQGFS
jgi:hypothetical protein